jgi:hypothetical protein
MRERSVSLTACASRRGLTISVVAARRAGYEGGSRHAWHPPHYGRRPLEHGPEEFREQKDDTAPEAGA